MGGAVDRIRRERLRRAQRLWRHDGLKPGVIAIYTQWLHRFEQDCERHSIDPDAALTRGSVQRFAVRYARRRSARLRTTWHAADVALHAWSRASTLLGFPVPVWTAAKPKPVLSPLLTAFAVHQRAERGLRPISIAKQCAQAAAFVEFLRRRHRRIARVHLADIDAFVVAQRQRCAVTTVADACSGLRGFIRFLHATGRIPVDLSTSIQRPCLRRGARPPRALPWSSVLRLLQAVDRRTRVGRRDYAVLLLLTTYGMGASEVASIDVDDIDWQRSTLRLTRPKTGVSTVLPLLPAVARALVMYLRRARPRSATTRRLFVGMTGLHQPWTSSSVVRHIIRKHARVAGLPLEGLGGHSLRHSHATRQVNAGAPPAVVSSILGHRSPGALSTYARVALDRLRTVALPVPT